MRALLLLLLAGCVTTEEGVTSSLDYVDNNPSNVFDVTTVYKLQGEDDSSENRGLADVPGCYVDGNSCDWEKSGWVVSDSNYAVAPFPMEVVHEGSTSASKMPEVIPITTKKFAISIKPRDWHSDFYIFLMAEEDADISDMLVILFKTDNPRSMSYKCMQTRVGDDRLPTMKNRMCTSLPYFNTREPQWDTLSFTSFSLEIDQYKVKVFHTKNQQIWFEMNLPQEFREMVGAIKYVGIQTNGDFKYSIPVDVLALSRRRGTLISPQIQRTQEATLLCVQMSVYIHPASKGSVAMSLKFNNGTNLNAGEIRTTNDKVELWRFMSAFNMDYKHSFKVHIEGSKNNTHPVVVTGITTCNVSGEFGNVVFDQPGPVEVHLRTNARGLPLLLPDGSIRSPKDGVQIPECTQPSLGCDWTQNNFTLATHNSKKPILNISDVNDVDWTSDTKRVTKPRRYTSPLKFGYDVTSTTGSYGGTFAILLMDSLQDITRSDLYLLQIGHYNAVSSSLYRCTRTDRSTTVSMPGGGQRSCTQIKNYDFEWQFSANHKFTFNLENVSGRIVLTVGYSGSKLVVFDWTDPSPIQVTHFALGSDDITGTLPGIPVFPVSALSQLTGSLTSPPLPPGLDRLCVSLVFYTDAGASIDLLLQQDNVETRIGTFLSGQPTGAWSHRSITAQVPRESRGEARIVVMATRQESTELLIQRVAGCNAEAPEDLYVLKKEPRIAAIDVPHYYNYSAVVHEVCLHGGLKEKTGRCVCRPGFRGVSCSEGCGANSYGSDCGGVCSESKHGCRGLVLCKPILGCDCAPGFKGLLCNTPCGSGEYGAGCRQRCGRCAKESCDAYTGVCHHGCQQGHYPPFCHKLYAYFKNPPSIIAKGFHDATVITDLQTYEGFGKPHFYQIQYKEKSDPTWTMETPQLYSEKIVSQKSEELRETSIVGHLTGLKPGAIYLVRVVLIDSNLASYQGGLVASTTFSTPCIVPREADYLNYENKNDANEVSISRVGDEWFEVEWKVSRGNATWCELIGYEVHVTADWRQVVHNVPSDVTHKNHTGVSPGKEYRVMVRGVTARGVAAFAQAKAMTATTVDHAPDHVRDLRLSQAAERSLKISWEEPRQTGGKIRRYLVKYQCLHLGACPEEDCAGSAGQVEVMATSAQLEGLLPYALYEISVVGISGLEGPASSIQAVTTLGAPEFAPSSAGTAVVSRTNSSFTVQWAASENCRLLNGYLTGYRYELFPPGQKSPLLVGTTTNTTATFTGLVPHSDFAVRVFATNSAGWSTAHALEIQAKTRATTPEVVENLTVYKRGRRMLGLRWSPPRMTYGSLKSFTVTHRPLDGSHKALGVTLNPSPCPAWPHLYCHTIKNLKADADYMVAVQARNSEVSEDGEEVAIKATTKEGAPSAPSYLRVVNKTVTSLTIEWGLPDLVNGQLRSFLVNVEETDSHNSSDCCQYFPLREVIVRAESRSYEYQMSGLKAASSYEVGVTAKTVSLGPAVSVTAHTRPRTPVFAHAPKLAEPARMGKSLKVLVEPSVDYQGDIVRGYMLLLKAETTDESSPIVDDWLANELNVSLNGSFSLAAEFNHMNLPEDGIVIVDPGQALVDGIFGSVGINALQTNVRYQPVWVLVLEYCGELSVGHILGEPFTVTEA